MAARDLSKTEGQQATLKKDMDQAASLSLPRMEMYSSFSVRGHCRSSAAASCDGGAEIHGQDLLGFFQRRDCAVGCCWLFLNLLTDSPENVSRWSCGRGRGIAHGRASARAARHECKFREVSGSSPGILSITGVARSTSRPRLPRLCMPMLRVS